MPDCTELQFCVDGIAVWAMFCTRCALARVLWCLAAFSVAWATHGLAFIDGAGAPWVLTWTHQRDAPPKQGGGDIREPTLCGWCCRGRQCRHGRECVITRATFRHTPRRGSDDSFRYDHSHHTTGKSPQLAHSPSYQCTGLQHPSRFSAPFESSSRHERNFAFPGRARWAINQQHQLVVCVAVHTCNRSPRRHKFISTCIKPTVVNASAHLYPFNTSIQKLETQSHPQPTCSSTQLGLQLWPSMTQSSVRTHTDS